MAIAFRAASFINATGGNNVTASEPAGTAQNDVLVALGVLVGTSASIAAPSGWTTLKAGSSPNNDFRYTMAYIVRGASAPDLTFVYTGTNRYREVFILGFTGCDTANPLDAEAAAVASGVGARNTALDPPAVTAVDSAAMAVAMGIHWAGSSGGWTAPAGYTRQSDNTSGNDGVMATKLLSASGSENPANFTTTGTTSDDFVAHTITLKPAGGTNATVTAVLTTCALDAPTATVTATGTVTAAATASNTSAPSANATASASIQSPAVAAPVSAPAAVVSGNGGGSTVTAVIAACQGDAPTATIAAEGTVAAVAAAGLNDAPAGAFSAGVRVAAVPADVNPEALRPTIDPAPEGGEGFPGDVAATLAEAST